MLFGHRRDVDGYARALETFDQSLGSFLSRVNPDDLVIITADPGNDPTFRGTDHTREQVPLFVLHRGQSREVGTRETFVDVAVTVSEFFRIEVGKSEPRFLTSAHDHVTIGHDHYRLRI